MKSNLLNHVFKLQALYLISINYIFNYYTYAQWKSQNNTEKQDISKTRVC